MASPTVCDNDSIKGNLLVQSRQHPLDLDHHRLWHLGSAFQWASFDAFAAFSCMWVAFKLTPAARTIPDVVGHLSMSTAGVLYAVLAFFLSYALGLSHYPNLRSRFRIVSLVTFFVFLATALLLGVTGFLLYMQLGRIIVLIASLMLWLLSVGARLVWFERVRQSVHHILVLGDSYVLGPLDEMLSTATFPIKVVARHVSPQDNETHSPFLSLLDGGQIHEVLVHGQNTLNSRVLLDAMDRGITVSTFETFSERHFFKIPSAFLSHSWFFQIDLKRQHPFYTSSKRAMDVALALIGGLLTLPLLAVALCLIKVTSKGPVFYSQIRVGEGQEPFKIWKLRTMKVDSEKNGAQWAKLKDSRVTLVGNILRKTRMDEVPQFWNIFVGDMSFIGPRPERPEFVEKLAINIPYYRQRHLVKPGLTGWAQICYRYGASEEDAREKLSYDLYYLKNASWLLDFQIMLQTIGAIAKGAR